MEYSKNINSFNDITNDIHISEDPKSSISELYIERKSYNKFKNRVNLI